MKKLSTKTMIRVYDQDMGCVVDFPDDFQTIPSIGDVIIYPGREDFVHHEGKFPRMAFKVLRRYFSPNLEVKDYDLVRVALLVTQIPYKDDIEEFC